MGMMHSSDLRFLDPHDAPARQAWDNLVRASSAGTVFHTTAWMDVVRTGIGLPPRFAYLPGSGGTIRALVPLFQAGGFWRSRRWLNIPQSVSSEPIAVSDADTTALLEAVAAAAATQRVDAVILRTARPWTPALPAGWGTHTFNPLLRHVLSLAGAKDVESLPNARYNHRQSMRTLRKKLPKQGIELRFVGPDGVREFTRVAHTILLASHGHLGMPVGFFRALLEYLPTTARLGIVGPGDGPALAFILCLWSQTLCSGLYGTGLPTREGRDAFRYATGLEIEAAINAGLNTFDFGETGPEQEGLIFYKEGWGAERVDGRYLVLAREGGDSGLRDLSQSMPWITTLMRKVPVSVSLAMAGPIHRRLQ